MNLKRVMEAGNHFKNGASPKSHTGREKIRVAQLLNKIVMTVIITMLVAGVSNAQTSTNTQQTEWEKQQAAMQTEREKRQVEREQLRAERETEREKRQALARVEREKLQVEQEKQRVERENLRAEREKQRERQQAALSEYKREIKKEYPVSSSPSLSINNTFGNIQIIEGAGDKIIFNITITGRGRDSEDAKKYAESVDVNFNQSANSVSAKTVFKDIQCNNCGRTVNYEVTVPKNTKHALENKYGDIKMNNAVEPLNIDLQFGKLYANELSEANLSIQYGGASINKCSNMKIKSGFSKYELGIIGTMTGSISYDGFKIDELGSADFKSEFSNMDIGKFKTSFRAEKFSYGSLKIGRVEENFSNIKVNASFTKVNVALTGNHNFKTTLYSNFGSIKTGSVVFYEKSLDKKDVVVGTAGKLKEPPATVEISNSYGNIVFE